MKSKIIPRTSEQTALLGVWVPQSLMDLINRKARSLVTNRSEAARQLLMDSLRREGLVATEAEIMEWSR